MRLTNLISRIFLCLAIISVAAFESKAQFFDNFSDGNISENPTWFGNIEHFSVTDQGELQLNAPQAGTSLLFTPITHFDTTVWDIYFKMDFAPSVTNRLRIYLYNESTNFNEGDAIYLEIGENGNEDDIIAFQRKDGQLTRLDKANGSNLANTPAISRIQTTFYAPDQWVVKADYSGGKSGVEVLHFQSEYQPTTDLNFGLECTYTATRTDKFFFDDIGVNPFVKDTSTPKIENFTVVEDNSIQLNFSKHLSNNHIEILDQYFWVERGINAASATLSTPTSILVTFPQEFSNGSTVNIIVSGVQDTLGNTMRDTTLQFEYLIGNAPTLGDVVITEIMADPSPVVNLPDAEYIEIYNRSNKFIDLNELKLQRSSTTYNIPAGILEPGKYLVLTRAADAVLFEPITPNVVGLSSFPAITNGGDQLRLVTSGGDCIHQVSFTSSDYGSSSKSDGGWSLELLYANHPCFSTSWTASLNNNGGTPGKENSIALDVPDSKLIQGFSVDNQTITIRTNQLFHPDLITNKDNWALTPQGTIHGIDYFLCSENFLEIVIYSDVFEEGIEYKLTYRAALPDCTGEVYIMDEAINFVKPQLPAVGDLVINEILHSPNSGGSRYIELYNQSDNFLKTGDLGWRSSNGQIVRISSDHIIPPKSFFTFAANRANVLETYRVENPEWLIETSLPSMTNAGGNVVLLGFIPGEVLVLDSVSYVEDWHSPLVKNNSGVSLERITYGGDSNHSSNWHSAAWNAGNGTPTAQNSQHRTTTNNVENSITLEPKTFSPDGDGYNDFLSINFNMNESFHLKVTIYDLMGREVKVLANNHVIGTNSNLVWDGTDHNGNKVSLGAYLIFVEGSNPTSGERIKEKLSCLVAGYLN